MYIFVKRQMTTSPGSFCRPEVVTQVLDFWREKSGAFWRTVRSTGTTFSSLIDSDALGTVVTPKCTDA